MELIVKTFPVSGSGKYLIITLFRPCGLTAAFLRVRGVENPMVFTCSRVQPLGDTTCDLIFPNNFMALIPYGYSNLLS